MFGVRIARQASARSHRLSWSAGLVGLPDQVDAPFTRAADVSIKGTDPLERRC